MARDYKGLQSAKDLQAIDEKLEAQYAPAQVRDRKPICKVTKAWLLASVLVLQIFVLLWISRWLEIRYADAIGRWHAVPVHKISR